MNEFNMKAWHCYLVWLQIFYVSIWTVASTMSVGFDNSFVIFPINIFYTRVHCIANKSFPIFFVLAKHEWTYSQSVSYGINYISFNTGVIVFPQMFIRIFLFRNIGSILSSLEKLKEFLQKSRLDSESGCEISTTLIGVLLVNKKYKTM